MRLIDLTGLRFGRLTVVERAGARAKHTMWVCQCECGNKTIADGAHLRDGHTKSCGCLSREIAKKTFTVHKLSKTRIYNIWSSMKARCYNANHKCFKDYGGRGITVCEEWKNSFETFYEWAMSNGYADNLSIDRIDVNGNYEPSNCRWTTQKEQANNKRNLHLLFHNGRTKTLSQWADEIGISAYTLRTRISRGWEPERALKPLSKEGGGNNEKI